MSILGYVFGIRSERALARKVQVNLAYRWFCGLGIEDAVPDHSAFSRARNERFADGDILRLVFERVVASCIAADTVGGEGFAVDASLIEADANRRRSVNGQDWNKDIDPETASRATREYLAWRAGTDRQYLALIRPVLIDDTIFFATADYVGNCASCSGTATQGE